MSWMQKNISLKTFQKHHIQHLQYLQKNIHKKSNNNNNNNKQQQKEEHNWNYYTAFVFLASSDNGFW